MTHHTMIRDFVVYTMHFKQIGAWYPVNAVHGSERGQYPADMHAQMLFYANKVHASTVSSAKSLQTSGQNVIKLCPREVATGSSVKSLGR